MSLLFNINVEYDSFKNFVDLKSDFEMALIYIELIYLPPYSPHLNPIEQIWRQMKREIKHYYLESKEFLQELTIKTYNESISGTKVYDKWLKTYIPKVW